MRDYLFAGAELAQAAVDPEFGELLLNGVLREPAAQAVEADVVERLKSFQRPEGLEKLKLVVATSERGARGVTSACSDVFRQMETDSACLWLDLNDVESTDNLFEVLLEAAYIRLGQEEGAQLLVG